MAELRSILSSGDIDNISTEEVDFRPVAASPTNVEGRVFYPTDKRTITSFNDVDMELNHGAEGIIRVTNNTGATILNATPVYNTGAVANKPSVDIASADSILTSSLIGITTYDLPNGSATEGFITRSGELGGDFSAFNVGDILYVADSSSIININGLTDIAPDIASRVGIVLQNTVNGTVLVLIENNTALPTILAYLSQGVSPGTITSTYQTFTNFTIFDTVVMTLDPVAGRITTPTTGFYRLTMNISLLHDTTGNNRPQVSLNVRNITQSLDNVYQIGLGRDATGTQLTVSIVFPATLNNTYELQILSDSNLNNVTASLVAWDLTSMHIR